MDNSFGKNIFYLLSFNSTCNEISYLLAAGSWEARGQECESKLVSPLDFCKNKLRFQHQHGRDWEIYLLQSQCWTSQSYNVVSYQRSSLFVSDTRMLASFSRFSLTWNITSLRQRKKMMPTLDIWSRLLLMYSWTFLLDLQYQSVFLSWARFFF